jgi:hypothetical protein
MEKLLPIQLRTRVPFGFVDRSPAVDFYVQKRMVICSRQLRQLGGPQV